MRETIYKCDCCDTVFGSKTHLNLKCITLFESVQDKMNKNMWKGKNIISTGYAGSKGELHFCNQICLRTYLTKLINERSANDL